MILLNFSVFESYALYLVKISLILVSVKSDLII